MDYLSYSETAVQEFVHPMLSAKGIRLLLKREDVNHPTVSGNKWWKLKWNLLEARRAGFQKILTFGGAYSNHIFATAAAAELMGLKSVGVIRGEETVPLNPTLTFARNHNMTLHYVQRNRYQKKDDPDFLRELRDKYGDFFLIPEGGTNALAIKGCAEFARQLEFVSFDALVLPVGTGGTIAGLLTGLTRPVTVIGVPVLKGGEFLYADIDALKNGSGAASLNSFTLLTDYHHGGYGKVSRELIAFINMMESQYKLILDPVYTGKMLFAIFKEIEKGAFREGTSILAIHTGGLQGRDTIMNRFRSA